MHLEEGDQGDCRKGRRRIAGEDAKKHGKSASDFNNRYDVYPDWSESKSSKEPNDLIECGKLLPSVYKKHDTYRNADEQEKVNKRATSLETRLNKQYSALDAQMASLTALSNYVNQQVTLWNKSTG